MPAYQLLPACKDYIWGGQRLKTDFGILSDLSPLAEAWVLSCHPDGPSVLKDGPYAGQTLSAYIGKVGGEVLGANCRQFENFPMLIKLIDAKQNLSVQVHPSDAYALSHEGQYGKTGMWVVLDTAPGSCLCYGFRQEITAEELARRTADGTLTEVLRAIPVKRGDVFFIPSDTLHAIGAGLVIAEVQQNSNVTYRVFDYGRVGPDGLPRQLHIEKALAVTDLRPTASPDFGPHLGRCRYFTADGHDGAFSSVCGTDSFHALLFTDGSGTLLCGGESRAVRKGECFFALFRGIITPHTEIVVRLSTFTSHPVRSGAPSRGALVRNGHYAEIPDCAAALDISQISCLFGPSRPRRPWACARDGGSIQPQGKAAPVRS